MGEKLTLMFDKDTGNITYRVNGGGLETAVDRDGKTIVAKQIKDQDTFYLSLFTSAMPAGFRIQVVSDKPVTRERYID